MGEYFRYVNLDRREYFDIDALGGATKASGIGRNLGARAFALLLTRRGGGGAGGQVAVGSWAGDRVAVIGDYIEPNALGVATGSERNLWSVVDEEYRDISSSVAVMLLDSDGPDELVEAARHRTDLFVLLAELALVHRQAACLKLMAEHFPEWQKRYAKLRAACRRIVPPLR